MDDNSECITSLRTKHPLTKAHIQLQHLRVYISASVESFLGRRFAPLNESTHGYIRSQNWLQTRRTVYNAIRSPTYDEHIE
jgi:hypothetical protein